MGASPVSQLGTDEEVEKLKWAERWGADTVMDLSTGGDLDATRRGDHRNATVPIGTVPIYSMIIGARSKTSTRDRPRDRRAPGQQGVDYMTIHAGVRKRHLPLVKDRLIGIVSAAARCSPSGCSPQQRETRCTPSGTTSARSCASTTSRSPSATACRPGGLADATDEAQLAELADHRRADRARLAPRRAGHGRGPGARAVRPDRVQRQAPAPPLPRRAVLRAGPARHRRLPGLRPHHELHRRDLDRLPRREHALLRHAQGAPGPAQARATSRRAASPTRSPPTPPTSRSASPARATGTTS
jgi:hypothetical protein